MRKTQEIIDNRPKIDPQIIDRGGFDGGEFGAKMVLKNAQEKQELKRSQRRMRNSSIVFIAFLGGLIYLATRK